MIGLLVWTLDLAVIFQPLNAPLQTPPAPLGIVSLQLAWTPEKTQVILDSWDTRARLFAAFGLGLDYLFLVSYALTLALAALLVAERHLSTGWFACLGPWVAAGAFLAAVCDVIENFCQTLQLFHQQIELALFVGVCATVKFVLIAVAILYGLAGRLWPAQRQVVDSPK